MAMLKPRIAVLDETDSGLDIDALKVVAEGVNALVEPEMGVLLITHYQRLLNYIKPDSCTSWSTGGSSSRAAPSWRDKLEESGYDAVARGSGSVVTNGTGGNGHGT